MGNVTNLNRFKKQRARDDRRAQADANAAKFGRSKAQKATETKSVEQANAHLDGHRLGDTLLPPPKTQGEAKDDPDAEE
ncbi:hypothetical protein BFP70_12615 [Thioclava sp. SK-1]|uniref:DUF4169 family protein n=1 Tax=Thioclava sp. SK-1 TaxID=1889770 RepID=UPI000824D686|nr:DUF4169 family protein [Thioclava sp. SK-1]OCX63054.1 hypothetical protein BFP70_12615 [Thioclava sp. SK-1]